MGIADNIESPNLIKPHYPLMSVDPPRDLSHLIYEALSQLGWSSDPTHLAERVNRLNIGLPREDEFAVVCSWLGHCALIHKLDQNQVPPLSEKTFQVPDLLAVFLNKGKSIPVLIEVKSSEANNLSFRPDYFTRLREYAGLLNIPMLIAWKYPSHYTQVSASLNCLA